jgi:hypothetical protein
MEATFNPYAMRYDHYIAFGALGQFLKEQIDSMLNINQSLASNGRPCLINFSHIVVEFYIWPMMLRSIFLG